MLNLYFLGGKFVLYRPAKLRGGLAVAFPYDLHLGIGVAPVSRVGAFLTREIHHAGVRRIDTVFAREVCHLVKERTGDASFQWALEKATEVELINEPAKRQIAIEPLSEQAVVAK